MAIEHRVREAVDAYVARIRHDLDAHVRSLTSDLVRLVGEQQDHWRRELEHGVAEARGEAERNFRQRIDTIREELQREADSRLVQQRAELQQAIEAAKTLAIKAEAEAEAVKAQALKAEADRAAAAMAAPPASETSDPDLRETRVDTVERLLKSVRRIDDADTLSGILEALAEGAAAETSRVAILLIEGELFHVWGHFGFAGGVGPTDMPIGASGTLAAAVALRQTSFVPPLIEGRESSMPGFMRVPVGFTGLVVPLTVGGDVVAVLYADDVDRDAEQEDAQVWTEEVELLTRHAALRLENVTSVRTAQVMARAD